MTITQLINDKFGPNQINRFDVLSCYIICEFQLRIDWWWPPWILLKLFTGHNQPEYVALGLRLISKNQYVMAFIAGNFHISITKCDMLIRKILLVFHAVETSAYFARGILNLRQFSILIRFDLSEILSLRGNKGIHNDIFFQQFINKNDDVCNMDFCSRHLYF